MAGSTDLKAAAMATVATATGTSNDFLEKRREIRMANLSAAEMLKAEMMSAVPVNPAARKKHLAQIRAAAKVEDTAKPPEPSPVEPIPEDQQQQPNINNSTPSSDEQPIAADSPPEANQSEEPIETPNDVAFDVDSPPHGVKRKADEAEDAEGEDIEDYDLGPDDEEEEANESSAAPKRVVNPDGTVEQEDTVKQVEFYVVLTSANLICIDFGSPGIKKDITNRNLA